MRRLMLDREMRKPRESGREVRAFRRLMARFPDGFPEPLPGRPSWHINIPVAQRIVDGPKARHGTRRKCVQTLLDWSDRLRQLRPPPLADTRIFITIALPSLFRSSMDITFSEAEWSQYIRREKPEYSWEPLPRGIDVLWKWGINRRPWQQVRGFREQIRDEDEQSKGEIWLVGEVEDRSTKAS